MFWYSSQIKHVLLVIGWFVFYGHICWYTFNGRKKNVIYLTLRAHKVTAPIINLFRLQHLHMFSMKLCDASSLRWLSLFWLSWDFEKGRRKGTPISWIPFKMGTLALLMLVFTKAIRSWLMRILKLSLVQGVTCRHECNAGSQPITSPTNEKYTWYTCMTSMDYVGQGV